MKYIKPIFLCIIIGFSMGFFLYSGYEKNKNWMPVLKKGDTVYFLKVGVYDNEEAMENALVSLPNYIYQFQNQKFHVYIGMSISTSNINKIKEYYKNLGYVVSEEKFLISNQDFIDCLKTYDEMLEKTEDKSVISNIINGVMAKYEELVGSE